MDRSALKKALLQKLEQDLTIATAAQKASHEGATHEENRPEGVKDMRSTEVSYLARGQAERVVALRAAVMQVEGLELRVFDEDAAVGLSAVVRLESAAEVSSLYWVAPVGGGIRLSVEGLELTVVTPQSPLGRALLGQRVGDTVELRTPQGLREQVVVEVY